MSSLLEQLGRSSMTKLCKWMIRAMKINGELDEITRKCAYGCNG